MFEKDRINDFVWPRTEEDKIQKARSLNEVIRSISGNGSENRKAISNADHICQSYICQYR